MSVSKEVNIPFFVKGEKYHTWSESFGDPFDESKVPLIILHGGPAIPHQYMSPHKRLLRSDYLGDIPIIFYDQIGCGNSSRPHQSDSGKTKAGFDAAAFYTVDLFSDELETVLKHYKLLENGRKFDLLGHSWGGMLAADYVVNRLKGSSKNLRKLILADAPASMETWSDAVNQLLNRDDEIHKAIREGLKNSDDPDKYTMMFYRLHICKTLKDNHGKIEWPHDLQSAFDSMLADSCVYETMIGPSEFDITGTLKKWSVIVNKKVNIKVPTLVINGEDDEAQDVCVKPFVEGIDKSLVSWKKFAKSSHMPFWEDDREAYFQAITEFLKQ